MSEQWVSLHLETNQAENMHAPVDATVADLSTWVCGQQHDVNIEVKAIYTVQDRGSRIFELLTYFVPPSLLDPSSLINELHDFPPPTPRSWASRIGPT